MSDTLTAKKREKTGSRAAMKLRAAGAIPAVLYGHKEKPQSLSIEERELRKALAHKAKVVKLTGDASGQAIVQALQWDTFHRDLLHVDLLRVSVGEKVQVSVPLEMKGEPAGAEDGGVLTLVVDHIELEAAPANIPEVLHVNVGPLQIGDNLHASDITDLPEGATLLTEEDVVLVTCQPPAGEPSLESVAAEGGTPEVVGEGEQGEGSGEAAPGDAKGDE